MRYLHQSEPGRQHVATEEGLSAFLDLREKLRSHHPPGSQSEPAELRGAETLLGTIEGEIIPRLLLAHRTAAAPTIKGDDPSLHDGDRARFLKILRSESAASSRSFVDALLERGVRPEQILLDLLTSAARGLGELWEEDLCDFTEVTIGLCRLHEILHALGADPVHAQENAPRVVLATILGDQHVFGMVMVAEFFRREGWWVWSEPGAPHAQLADLLGKQRFDVLGVSLACSHSVREVAAEIGALRRASRNEELKVLVGGRLVSEHRTIVGDVGADGSAIDASQAPIAGRELLSRP